METPVTLLDRLRSQKGQEDWVAFCNLYYPLVLSWCRRACSDYHQALDLTQEIFLDVHRKIGFFQRRKPGSLRAWFRRLLMTKLAVIQPRRFPELLEFDEIRELRSISQSGSTDRVQYQALFDAACEAIRHEFSELSWQMFQATFVEGEDPTAVGHRHGMSRNSVYIARCRITRRLKEYLTEKFI